MMMYSEWVVEGYVGYTYHEVVLDGHDYPTQEVAIEAATKCMLWEEGFDPEDEEDVALVLIWDVQPRYWYE